MLQLLTACVAQYNFFYQLSTVINFQVRVCRVCKNTRLYYTIMGVTRHWGVVRPGEGGPGCPTWMFWPTGHVLAPIGRSGWTILWTKSGTTMVILVVPCVTPLSIYREKNGPPREPGTAIMCKGSQWFIMARWCRSGRRPYFLHIALFSREQTITLTNEQAIEYSLTVSMSLCTPFVNGWYGKFKITHFCKSTFFWVKKQLL